MNDRERHHSASSTAGWVTALCVIAIGVLLLLANLGVPFPFVVIGNWWALFIFIGAIPSLTTAVQRYRERGRVDGVVIQSLATAAAIATVAFIFLLSLSWATWWPLFVIIGGLLMLGRHHEAHRHDADRDDGSQP